MRSSASRAFRGDIQGLRAVAVGAVVLYHAGVPFLPGGYVGVDIFFVISGFLITSHLLTTLERDDRLSFASFYAKRARRILPASFVVLVLSVVAAMIWFPPLLLREVWKGAVATALYVPNLLFAVDGTNYLAEETPSLFQHYWSLGVEEQFYLVWPAVLAIGWRFVRPRRRLFALLLAMVGLSLLLCVVLTFSHQSWAFFSLPTRAWELGIGGLLAFHLARSPKLLPPVFASTLGWVGIVGILGSILLFTSATAFPGYWAFVPVAATGLVIWSGSTAPRYGPRAMLSSRGMLFLGAISYSLYLVHWPAMIVPQAAAGFRNPLPLWLTLLIALVCVPAAWVLYMSIENPARKSRWLRGARPRRSLIFAAIGSVSSVVIATGVYAYSLTIPLSTSAVVASQAVRLSPVGTDFVPKNLTPSLRNASEDQPILYSDGCHRDFDSTDPTGCLFGGSEAKRIALFGDSHAAHWFPALEIFAEEHGYSVETYTKSSCPSVSADVIRDGVLYEECTVWRDRVITLLNERPPDIVVISNFEASYQFGSTGESAVVWEAALSKTLERLKSGAVVIADTPDFLETPAACLSANLHDANACAKDRRAALRTDIRDADARAASTQGAEFVDLTDYLCNADTCPVIIGNTLVYRDAHHLTATFSSLLAAPLGNSLSRALELPR